MSTQQLRVFQRGEPEAGTPAHMQLRRAFIFVSTAVLTSAGCYEMYEVVQVGGVTVLEWMVLVLFVTAVRLDRLLVLVCVGWLCGVAVSEQGPARHRSRSAASAVASRNAMLLPTYNEDPYRIMARLRAMHESVDQAGYGASFDWFVLSDTTDPAIWIAEEKCFLQLRQDSWGCERLLPSPPGKYRPEIRQYRRLDQAVRRRLMII